jgi:hypothetical protein
MLRIPVGLVLLSLGAVPAAADGRGLALLGAFEQTCGQRPALPTVLQRLAKAVGFESQDGDIRPDLERGDKLDVTYFAKLVQGEATFGLSACFSGSTDAPEVTCSMGAIDANAKDLAAAVEAAEHVASPDTAVSKDGALVTLKWTFGAANRSDWLEMRARRDEPRRTGLTLSYQVRKP